VVRIDSPTNPRVRDVVRAMRDGDLVAVEGGRAVTEALTDGVRPVFVFHEPGALDQALLDRISAAGAEVIEASARVVTRLSDLPSSRGVVALAAPPRCRLADLPSPEAPITLLLDSVQDPTNVGAILRSAEAFGAGAVILTPGTASPFSPKAMRASAGSVFRLPVVLDVDAADALTWARTAGARVVGADVKRGIDPVALRHTSRVLLVIGSEGHGLSTEISEALDVRVTIPLRGRVESLNAAVAAAVLLYALSPKISASNR
jgi:RNA methyltransferase, TrmH family